MWAMIEKLRMRWMGVDMKDVRAQLAGQVSALALEDHIDALADEFGDRDLGLVVKLLQPLTLLGRDVDGCGDLLPRHAGDNAWPYVNSLRADHLRDQAFEPTVVSHHDERAWPALLPRTALDTGGARGAGRRLDLDPGRGRLRQHPDHRAGQPLLRR